MSGRRSHILLPFCFVAFRTCILAPDEASASATTEPAGDVILVDSIPVVLPDTAVANGTRLDLALTVDMSGVAGPLGAVQGVIRFPTSSLSFVGVAQGSFAGSLELNTDSASAGVIRFAAANADTALNRGSVSVVVLTVDVTGSGGEITAVTPEVSELVLAGSFADMTASARAEAGSVLVDPGPVKLELRPDPWGATQGESTFADLRLDLTSSSAVPGALSGKLTLDPTVVGVDSVVGGDFVGSLTSNVAPLADSGFVRWAALGTDPLVSDTMLVARFWLTALASERSTSNVALTVTEAVNAPNLASLLPVLKGPGALTFTVLGGFWGDASLTWRDQPGSSPVTAFDALICLSYVVGRNIGAFDTGRCDVAPDAGVAYDGTITSLDALVILTFVVGSDTSGYRVGQPR